MTRNRSSTPTAARFAAAALLLALLAGCEDDAERAPGGSIPLLADSAAPAGPAASPTPARAETVASPAAAADTTHDPDLVDPSIGPAIAGVDGWGHHQSVRADLDGDGESERVVITARVEMVRGRPAWDDGQPWQVYVEESDGGRTYLYARRLQLGTLTMRVGVRDGPRRATVVLLEHLPDRMLLAEVEYDGPSRVRTTEHFVRRLDPTGDLASPALP